MGAQRGVKQAVEAAQPRVGPAAGGQCLGTTVLACTRVHTHILLQVPWVPLQKRNNFVFKFVYFKEFFLGFIMYLNNEHLINNEHLTWPAIRPQYASKI